MKHYSHLKNLYRGFPGLIVANGPGLANVSDEFLASYVTIGCNRIVAKYPGFCPTYYVEIGFNHLDTPARRKEMNTFLLDDRCKGMIINRLWVHEFPNPKVYSVLGGRAYGVQDHTLRDFSLEPFHIIGIGYTVTYTMLQLAYYMGFDPVLLVGLDHDYEGQPHFYKNEDFPEFDSKGPYTTKAWTTGADIVFSMARAAYEAAGKRVINISEPTSCTIFERGRLEEWSV